MANKQRKTMRDFYDNKRGGDGNGKSIKIATNRSAMQGNIKIEMSSKSSGFVAVDFPFRVVDHFVRNPERESS